tara:strand:- start:655 stop:870 length:216 start_codon:yes stop_codon:yes gene_type:complete
MKKNNREELRNKLRKKLREKIDLKKISRTTKSNKEQILQKSLATMGIDKDKLKADIEALKKQGGLSLKIPN